MEPEGSGVMLAVRTASRIPAKPAVSAQSTKLRTSTRLTLMPASAAPSRLPPAATVYIPDRVNDSTSCKRITIPTAQISSE